MNQFYQGFITCFLGVFIFLWIRIFIKAVKNFINDTE